MKYCAIFRNQCFWTTLAVLISRMPTIYYKSTRRTKTGDNIIQFGYNFHELRQQGTITFFLRSAQLRKLWGEANIWTAIIMELYLEALKIWRAGTLHVITAHARMYIRTMSLILLMAGSIGTKNKPSQIMPWLFTRCSTFSATLNSPYSGWNNQVSIGLGMFSSAERLS